MQPNDPFFYRTNIKKWCWRILVFFCVTPILFELLFVKRYSHFAKNGFQSVDGFTAFYGALGIIGSLLFVMIAKFIGHFIQVGETYYHDDF